MAGYNPASVTVSNLPQAASVIHYDKEFIKNLKANTPFLRITARRALPQNAGIGYRMFEYGLFGANLAQQAEGTVGSGITPTVLNTTPIIGQYADYANVSDMALETTIDPLLENLDKEMAYRLALSASTIVRNTFDGLIALDASVNIQKAASTPCVIGDFVSACQAMRGRNIKPFDAGTNRFVGVIHPFVVGDIRNDSANNSLADIYKHTTEGLDRLMELPDGGDGNVQVLDFGGFRFHESSIVTTTANYKGSGALGYRTYIAGEEAVITISLGAKGNSQIGEGDWHNLKLKINRYDGSYPSDPAGVIGGSVAYNVKLTTSAPPDNVGRARLIDANSNIS